MKRFSKFLLVISVAGFALSLTSFGSAIHYGMLKPVSAILFIVFFILHVLQKEVEKYDVEHQANIARGSRAPALTSVGLPKAHAANNKRFATAH
jgi:hypothetical protein